MTELRRYSSVATKTTLTTGITNLSTGMTLTNPSGYPLTDFTVRVDDEAVLVGTNTGGVLTDITRGYDGTYATAHSTAVDVNHVAVGEDFDFRWQDVALDRPRGTDDDEFGAVTQDAAWTEVTPTGSVTWTQGNGLMSVTGGNQTVSDLCALVKPINVLPPYTIETALRVMAERSDFTMAGLVFADGNSPSSNVVVAMPYMGTTGWFNADQRTGQFTLATSDISTQLSDQHGPFLYVRLVWRAINNYGAEFSSDGVSWATMGFADMFTVFTPTHAGVLFSSWGDVSLTSRTVSYEYFRGANV